MPAFATLTDGFDDGVRDPVLWSGSYSTVEEAGGRARVPCTTGYAAYASATLYTAGRVAGRLPHGSSMAPLPRTAPTMTGV
ncbi:hypothetical protein ACFSL4_01765 [Streptomyces caeni]|uniref:Uncharacterized protein n=1 Tax=Streptomyces caeni TaxID=2307231 RepID=A0ABW4IKE1_9ACTN